MGWLSYARLTSCRKRPPRYIAVTEWKFPPIYFLIRFMPLPRYHDRVALPRIPDCGRDGHCPVFFDAVIVTLHACGNIADYGVSIFFSWVITGDDGFVRQSCCHFAHEGPFAMVTVASASKYTDHSLVACFIPGRSPGFDNFSRRDEHFFKGIRSMRIIDHDKGQLTAAYLLHSARYRPYLSQGLYSIPQFDPTGHQNSDYPQQV